MEQIKEQIEERIKELEGMKAKSEEEIKCNNIRIDAINTRLDELTWIYRELSKPAVR